MGKHRRSSDDKIDRLSGSREPILKQDADPETKAAHLAGSQGQAVVRVADKRLTGTQPYDLETGSKPAVDPESGKRKGQ